LVALPTLYAESDYITLHTALTPESNRMLSSDAFARMKQGVRIVNCARGELIDEDALKAALASGKVAGAALDVFDEEPLPQGHPFYKLENVLLSPHCADHTPDWLDNAMKFFLEQFERYRKGEPLLNVVDKKLGY